MSRLSLCMIVKNEASCLGDCLRSVQGLVDEIIIVDTGSTDETKKIAASFGAKVVDFIWGDDFSAARNESLKHATGDWILVLDADEVLPEESHVLIRKAIGKEADAYFLPQITFTNIHTTNPTFIEQEATILGTSFKGYYQGYIIRLFRRLPEYRFDFFVHEVVNYSIAKAGGKVQDLLAPVIHLSERKGMANVHQKQSYYFQLALKNIEAYPLYAKGYNDASLYYNSYLQDKAKAIALSRRAVELEPQTVEFLLNLSYRLREAEDYLGSLGVLQQALNVSQRDERVLIALGFIYYKLKEYQKSLYWYGKILDLHSPRKEQVRRIMETIRQEAHS